MEPVFRQSRHARGFRQFLLRGLEKVITEWNLVSLTHNRLKLFRSGRFSRQMGKKVTNPAAEAATGIVAQEIAAEGRTTRLRTPDSGLETGGLLQPDGLLA